MRSLSFLKRLLLSLSLSATLATVASPAAARAQECPAPEFEPSLAEISRAVRFRSTPARVPREVQNDTLMGLLERTSAMSKARREDSANPKAVIQIDLDFTCFRPLEGQKKAFKKMGQKFGIPEFLTPETLPVFPSQKKAAWVNFLEESGLQAKYPNAPWNDIYRDFNSQSWRNLMDGTEELTPGLARFVRRVKARGGVVVFNTARDEDMRTVTEGVLKRGGIKKPIVVMKPAGGSATPKHKAETQPGIAATHGRTIAFIDDIGENREAVREALTDLGYGDALMMPIAVPGFTNEEEWADFDARPERISTYETID